ncbi:MAG TPA: outer membrane beta-barrel protein [Rhizomicrobium sp.]|nr:outer membrane beta-barrel protein [Rhizomicrobium sp.]
MFVGTFFLLRRAGCLGWRPFAWALVPWFAAMMPAAGQAVLQPTVSPVNSVYQMARPQYETPGLEIGSFLLVPSLTQTLTYDDNIFASDIHRVSDLISNTSESVLLRSQWRRHGVTVRLFSSQQSYLDHGNENGNVYGTEANTRLDISDMARVEVDAGFVQQPQKRNSAQADRAALSRPVYNTVTGAMRYIHNWDRFRNTAEIGFMKTVYIDDDDAARSAVRWRYRDRLSFAVAGDTWAFLQAMYSTQNWRQSPQTRNFDSWTALAGFNTQISDLMDAELGVGMLRQQYSFSGFKDLVVPIFSGSLTWNILPLTTVSASAERTVSGLEVFCDRSLGSFPCAALAGRSIPGLLQDLNTYTGCQSGLCHDNPATHYAGILRQASRGLFGLPAGTIVAVPPEFQGVFGAAGVGVKEAFQNFEALRSALMRYSRGNQNFLFGDQRGSLTTTSAEIGVQHEFWHNLLGELQFRYEQDKFQPAGLINQNYIVTVDGRYLINRNMELGLSYTYHIRTANDDTLQFNSGPYRENTVSLALKITL